MNQSVNSNNDIQEIANHIRMCGELACLLEVSATPKPGNVHRFRDFEDTKYEHFLASSISFGQWLEKLAIKGIKIARNELAWSQLHLGEMIKRAIITSDSFHTGGNTNLGIILLLCPLSVSAGIATVEHNPPQLSDILGNVLKVLKHTTVDDAINVSEGIAIVSPGGLGKVEKYDVSSSSFRTELVDEKITLLKLMQNCRHKDNICKELAEGYPITFDIGFKALNQAFETCFDINLSIINAYLEILGNTPDTLIIRKFGLEKAQEVSNRAQQILEKGGALTIEGRRELEEFDIELREEEQINPGTTADLIASTLFVFLVLGNKI
ncbi:MAG: ATP--dephospho-CoA triphosphoribosyl transferase CitG [Candidatus Heimdallarchaeota archaeon]|nr:ATP--dephospho-CoA triphosphoribosyl transferase CitG [Candidatus Heimdallarchaeota archaeon]